MQTASSSAHAGPEAALLGGCRGAAQHFGTEAPPDTRKTSDTITKDLEGCGNDHTAVGPELLGRTTCVISASGLGAGDGAGLRAVSLMRSRMPISAQLAMTEDPP